MKAIWLVISRELRKIFGDRRTLFATLVLPGLSIFLIYTAIGQATKISGSELETRQIDVLVVEERRDSFVDYLDAIILSSGEEVDLGQFVFDSQTSSDQDPAALVEEQQYQVVVEFIPASGSAGAVVELVYDQTNSSSLRGANLLVAVLDLSATRPYTLVLDDVGVEKQGMMVLSLIGPMMIVMMLMAGAMAIVADSIAGEKERKTLGLLLLTPITKTQLAVAKVSANTILSLLCAIGSFIGLAASIPTSGNMFGVNGVSYGVGEYMMILVVIVSGALFIVSLLSLISTFARTTKEATALIMPFYLAGVVAAIVPGMLDGISSFAPVWMIPIYNLSLSLKAILTLDIQGWQLALTVGSNVALFAILIYSLTLLFRRERILFG